MSNWFCTRTSHEMSLLMLLDKTRKKQQRKQKGVKKKSQNWKFVMQQENVNGISNDYLNSE
jgi:hypothetical protein